MLRWLQIPSYGSTPSSTCQQTSSSPLAIARSPLHLQTIRALRGKWWQVRFGRSASPWPIEAVWAESREQDAPLIVEAYLGPVSQEEKINVMLADGTKYELSIGDLNLLDGEFHVFATTRSSSLLARLDRRASGEQSSRVGRQADTEIAMHSRAELGAAFALGLAVAAGLPGREAISLVAIIVFFAVCNLKWPGTSSETTPGEQAEENDYILQLRSEDRGSNETIPMSIDTGAHRAESQSLTCEIPASVAVVPEGAVNFDGHYKLNTERSDDPSDMLQAMGVPWIARKGALKLARECTIQQNGLEWTETMKTGICTKTVKMRLDETPHTEISPLDRAVITMKSRYEEDGQCVVTRSTSSRGDKTQVVARYMIEDGRVYHTRNVLTVAGPAGDQEMVTMNYFDRIP